MPYAKSVADYLSVDLHVVTIQPEDLMNGLQNMIWQLDEPLADPAPLNLFHISRLARDMDCRVLLSGSGGDDLFSGYRRHLAMNSEFLWSSLPRPLRILLRDCTAKLPVSSSFFRRARQFFSGCHLEGNSRLIHYFSWISQSDLYPLYSSDFRAVVFDSRAENVMHNFLANIPPDVSDRTYVVPRTALLPGRSQSYLYR